MKKRRAVNPVRTVILLTCLVVAWLFVAPAQFGGRATYVIVAGNSMEPTMYRGDLAILLRAEAYGIGDVVTYRHPRIGPVIHRIVAVDSDRFVLQGDNNDWKDDFRPREADMYGRLWFFVPRLGALLDRLRAPLPMTLLALAIGVAAMYPSMNAGSRRHVAGASATPRTRKGHSGVSSSDLLFAAAALAIAAAALAFYSFMQPLTRTVSATHQYTHRGAFSYQVDVPPGIYDETTAVTGDPIYRRVTQTLPVAFEYRFITENPAMMAGSCTLTAEVADGDGWRRTLEIQPAQAIQNNGCIAAGVIDLARVQELIDSFETQTGIARGQYTLSLTPQTMIQGDLAGSPISESFAPRYTFRIDADRLVPTTEEALVEQQGIIESEALENNTLPLPIGALDVGLARRLSLSLLMIAISAGLLFWRSILRIGQDIAAKVYSRYEGNLVVAHDLDLAGTRIVELAHVDDLGKLAESLGKPIVETPQGFVLLDGNVVYRLKSHSEDPSV